MVRQGKALKMIGFSSGVGRVEKSDEARIANDQYVEWPSLLMLNNDKSLVTV